MYAYNVVVVYRRLLQRRALIASYKGRTPSAEAAPRPGHTVVHAEYTSLLDTLVAKVRSRCTPPAAHNNAPARSFQTGLALSFETGPAALSKLAWPPS